MARLNNPSHQLVRSAEPWGVATKRSSGTVHPFLHALVPGRTQRLTPGDEPRVVVVFQGHISLVSNDLTVEITESYAAYLAPGLRHGLVAGPQGAVVALLTLPVLAPSTLARSPAAFRIEDSQSYFLLSRLVTSRLEQGVKPMAVGWLRALASHLAAQPGKMALDTGHRLAPALARLESWSQDAVPLEALADIVSMHPMSLTRSFRKTLGCSIGEYRQRVRAERAFYRVIKSPTSLCELSLVCGYADQSHLTRSFQRFFGVTPGGLRACFSQIRIPA